MKMGAEISPYELRLALTHKPTNFNYVACSPDGKQLATASSDGAVRIWEASSGTLLLTLEGHTNPVMCVTWSPDGGMLASASFDYTVRIWSSKAGKLIRTLEGHTDWVISVVWSPDGGMLASASYDGKLRIWDAEDGKLIWTLEGHTDRLNSVSWSPDGRKLASASDDQTVRIWNSKDGKLLRTLKGHTDCIRSVSWSPDGGLLASASYDNTVCIWNVKDGKKIHTLEGHISTANSVSWSPDGGTLASASYDKTVHIWNAKDGKLIRTLDGHTDWVNSVSWLQDGSMLVSASDDNTVRIWDAKDGKLIRTLEGHKGFFYSVSWSPNGDILASASKDKMVRIWNAKEDKTILTLEGHIGEVTSIAWSPNGRELASGSSDQTVCIWNAKDGKLIRTLDGHQRRVASVCWSPNGGELASGSSDNTARIWNAKNGKLICVLEGHTAAVNSVVWSPAGGKLASASNDSTVRIWKAKDGKMIHKLKGHTEFVNSVCWSPDGRLLASASHDNTVRIWNAKDGKLIRTLEGHTNSVRSVVWAIDRSTLASASNDNTVRIWDAKSGNVLGVLLQPFYLYASADLSYVRRRTTLPSFGKTCWGTPDIIIRTLSPDDQPAQKSEATVSIVSAKIVLMGESSVGKSALALRLAEDRFEEQTTTHGLRLWPVAPERISGKMQAPSGQKREVVLWDLGGQQEYRLVHQLFLNDTTLALMLIDPTRDSHFADLDEWCLRLPGAGKESKTRKLLVGTKSDELKGMVDRARIQEAQTKWQMSGFYLTSSRADQDEGIEQLREAIANEIDWNALGQTTRPRLFQVIRDEIDEQRRKGQVVLLFSDLQLRIRALFPDADDTAATDTVVRQLATQGAITDTRLSTGERALVLRVDAVEVYAGSLIQMARERLGVLGVPAIEISEAVMRRSLPGIPDDERLPALQERSVLECVIELMIDCGLCLKQQTWLVFPTLFPADASRSADAKGDHVSLFYDFSGAIDNIYSGLVARLAVSGRFGRVRLWKDRAQFERPGQGLCGLKRNDRSRGWAHLDLFFGPDASQDVRSLFTVFIEEHLREQGVTIEEVLQVNCIGCEHVFDASIVQARIDRGENDLVCPLCEKRTPIIRGAKALRDENPEIRRELIALRKTIEDITQREIREAKQEIKPFTAFISYSHKDDDLRRAFVEHLSILKKEGQLDAWHDGKILPGEVWADEIYSHLEEASLVFLLVSASFVKSEYCYEKEMRRALERHAQGVARVIPILVRPADVGALPFMKLQALPQDARAVTSWGNQDEAWVNVVQGIRKAILDVRGLSAPEQTKPKALETGGKLGIIEPPPTRILHLSDLHFGAGDDPVVRLEPLLSDLRDKCWGPRGACPEYLVISGDLTNSASAAEFEKVHQFLDGLMKALNISPERCVICPGNHDASWDTPDMYVWQPERKANVSSLNAAAYVRQGNGYLIQNPEHYPKRFENFGKFIHQLLNRPYSLGPEQQFRSIIFDKPRIQFLALNSAWKIDEYFETRSGIHERALSEALLAAEEQLHCVREQKLLSADEKVLRMAVFHHPIAGNDKIKEDAFLDRLRQAGVCACLHGHVHEDRAELVGYMHPRRLYAIGAGSYGASAVERPESIPRLYNILEIPFDLRHIRVHTRCMRKPGGAWEGWAVWPGSGAHERLTYYDIPNPDLHVSFTA